MGRTLAVALLLVTMVVAWPSGRASAAIDVSGQWTFAMTHPDFTGTISCAGAIVQSGTALTSSMTCDFFGNGTLNGSINTTSGALTLSGTMATSDQLNFSGTAAGDGDSMSGSWTITGIPGTGAFNGTRTAGVGGLAELSNLPPPGGGGGSSGPGGGVPFAVWLVGGSAVAVTLGAAAAVRRRLVETP